MHRAQVRPAQAPLQKLIAGKRPNAGPILSRLHLPACLLISCFQTRQK